MKSGKFILAGLFVSLGMGFTPVFAEPVGKVLVAVGDVSVTRAGQALKLVTGSALETGDVIRSAERSNTQLRMLDGTIVSIRPSSVFSIDDYKFDQAAGGKGSKAFFGLLKGGLRTITGMIGKMQPDGYRVTTPTSTIGIRGTHYAVRHCANDCQNPDGSKAKDGTFGRVFDGVIFVENKAGTKDFGKDEAFFVADSNTQPSSLIAAPDLLVDRLEGQGSFGASRRDGRVDGEVLAQSGLAADGRTSQPVATTPELSFVATQNVNSGGASAVLPPSGMATAMAYVLLEIPSPPGDYFTNSSADSNDQSIVAGTPLASVFSIGDAVSGGGGAARNDAVLTNTGSNALAGNVSWGVWSAPNAIGYYPTSGNPQSGIHVAIGDATPANAIPTAASAGTWVAFTHVGGTNPTNASGVAGAWTAGSLELDFYTQKMQTGATALAWSTGTATYSGVTFSNVAVNNGMNVMVTPAAGATCVGGGCATSAAMGANSLNINTTYVGTAGQGLIMSITTNVANEYSASVQVFKR